MTKSYENFDRPYRRGLVLGLSLAELFLILLFLLLLVAIGIVQEGDKTKKELDTLKQIMVIDGQPITPEEFEELVEAFDEKKKLEDKIKQLTDLVDNLTPLNERMQELDKAIANKDLTDAQEKIIKDKIVDLIEESKKIEDILEKLDIALSHNTDDTESKDINKLITELKNKNYTEEQREKLLDLLKSGISDFKPDDLIKKLSFLKGGGVIPCWFVKQDNKNKPRKEVKIFDLLMKDNSIVVARSSIKDYEYDPNFDQGNSSFLPRWKVRISQNKEFSYKKFSNEFLEYKKIGENKIQKDFICRFYVNIWDETSNKKFYKKRLRAIENIFYKFENNDNWPH